MVDHPPENAIRANLHLIANVEDLVHALPPHEVEEGVGLDLEVFREDHRLLLYL